MKNRTGKFLLATMMTMLVMSGCESIKKTNKTQRGAAIGTAGGAVIGGIIGNNVGKGNTALGAVMAVL